GEIKDFTGIDDPYEPPQHAEVILDTVSHTPEENAHLILDYLARQGFIRADGSSVKPSSDGSTGNVSDGKYNPVQAQYVSNKGAVETASPRLRRDARLRGQKHPSTEVDERL
ncbi:MAG: adenylyl-sulfate kinase, partial [Chloroflexota bacterium]